jgi:ATP-dependent helicase/nuclease subunit A
MSQADIAQKAASNPESSVWVSAHAGSGKTKVLSDRVIRLLLRGTHPSAILCLTYTRAAAAEMANRIYEKLAEWVTLSDDMLDDRIAALDRPATPALREKARRLFAESLETPGGLKVQTIHAFAGAILRKFPLEAGVPADFSELDQLNKARLKERALEKTLKTTSLDPVFKQLALLGGDAVLQGLFETIFDNAKALMSFYDDNNRDLSAVYSALCKNLGTDRSYLTIQESYTGDSPFSMMEIKDWAQRIAQFNKPTDLEFAKKWLDFADKNNKNDYINVFFTDNKTVRKSLIRVEIAKKYPKFFEQLNDEAARLFALVEEERAAKTREMTFTLMQVAVALIAHYEHEKRSGSFLDFDDLIDKTGELLTSGAASWVNYKLDQSIDHILVDEAQDTSPEQWEIIQSLAEEFTGGESSVTKKRTLFVVGDEKQSIYSFQGADPTKFDEMRHNFAQKFQNSGEEFKKIPLKTSFRSAPTVLRFVDEIASLPDVKAGLSPHDALEPHLAHHKFEGLVELWDLEMKPLGDEPTWRQSVDKTKGNVVILAQKIAKSIKIHLNEGYRPRDILILMKKRGDLFQEVNRALKLQHIPTAGSDRLVLRQSLAVADLLNLAESLLNPYDDHALAVLLRSPLFDVSEQALFDLAHGREASLYEALDDENLTRFNQMRSRLTLSPFGFYTSILIKMGGRACFITRFGREVEDILDSFMASLEKFEASNVPDLRDFIAMMRDANESIKRDLDASRDEVRVMTVHGSKGLEAPIVYLCDLTASAIGGGHKRFFNIKAAKPYPLWSSRKDDDPIILTKAREAEVENQLLEYQRLLYVALTRAEKKLILCGVERRKEKNKNWYDDISSLMAHLAFDEVKDPLGSGMIKRFYHEKPENPINSGVKAVKTPMKFDLPPLNLLANLQASKPRAPSESEILGTKIHRLMQILPDVPHEKHASIITAMVGEDYVHALSNLFLKPAFKELMAMQALTEVPISGIWQDQQIERRIDRLCLSGQKVIIVDYKTGAQSEITASIREQMACYKALLTSAFTGFDIESVVVFTTTGNIISV